MAQRFTDITRALFPHTECKQVGESGTLAVLELERSHKQPMIRSKKRLKIA
jgi:hypothetical protein